MVEKIDFVVTWVDESDTNWIKDKNKYQNNDIVLNGEDRYRNWNFFKYWFRAVEKYAPWVNKIFLITVGHVPEWINLDHDKLIHIKHSDYIEKQYLPTFNSNVIEWNIHKITELSKCFVSFNDDMFLNAEVNPSDFFINNKPRDCGVFSPIVPNVNGTASMTVNNIEILNKYFLKNKILKKNFFKFFNIKYGKHIIKNFCTIPWSPILGFYDDHIPISYNKSSFFSCWEREEEMIRNTCSHKFREKTDITHWLVRYWQLCEGNFVPRTTRFGKYYSISKDIKLIHNDIMYSKHKVICLNDDANINNFNYLKDELLFSFEKKFKMKSSYER